MLKFASFPFIMYITELGYNWNAVLELRSTIVNSVTTLHHLGQSVRPSRMKALSRSLRGPNTSETDDVNFLGPSEAASLFSRESFDPWIKRRPGPGCVSHYSTAEIFSSV